MSIRICHGYTDDTYFPLIIKSGNIHKKEQQDMIIKSQNKVYVIYFIIPVILQIFIIVSIQRMLNVFTKKGLVKTIYTHGCRSSHSKIEFEENFRTKPYKHDDKNKQAASFSSQRNAASITSNSHIFLQVVT